MKYELNIKLDGEQLAKVLAIVMSETKKEMTIETLQRFGRYTSLDINIKRSR